jgi:hypothetical protein
MKYVLIPVFLALLGGCASRNVVVAKVEPIGSAKEIAYQTVTHAPVCFLPDAPDVPHVVVGRLVATKKSYGSVEQLTPVASRMVKRVGGNAVFSWSAAQKFKGPNPFRATAPTGTGVVVLVGAPFDCTKLGGLEEK